MTRSEINPMPSYYDRYINLVEDIDLMDAMQQSLDHLHTLDMDRYNRLGDQVYAPGKWTLRQIFRHLSDWERVFCYRTLMTVRKMNAAMQSYDENLMADNSKANHISLEETIHDLIRTRIATISLFAGFDREDLTQLIQMPDNPIPVLAEGFIIIGHQIHHLNVIEERYMPMLKP